jgi:hypothetical protein
MIGDGGRGKVEPWPFSDAEWAAVSEAVLSVVNASLAEDAVLQASHLISLFDVLAGLRSRHGEHPVLLEMEADFAEDDFERVALYRRAASVAEVHGIQTLTIRLSLSRLLLDLGQREAAQVELRACQDEVPEGDDSDRASWAELVAESEHAEPNAAADGGRDLGSS